MRLIILSILVSFVSTANYAQDIVVKENGDTLSSQVTKVKLNSVTYTEQDNPELTTSKDKVKDIKYIKYGLKGHHINKLIPTSYISFSALTSIPSGSFKATNGGQASAGRQGFIDVNLYIKKNWGVSSNMGVYKFPLSNDIENELKKDIFPLLENVNYESDSWSGAYIQTGLLYSKKFKNLHFLTFDAKIQGGIISTRAPQYGYSYYLLGIGSIDVFTGDRPTTFFLTSTAELAVRIDISKSMGIKLLTGLSTASLKVKYTEHTNKRDDFGFIIEESIQEQNYQQNLLSLNYGIGLYFDIHRKNHF